MTNEPVATNGYLAVVLAVLAPILGKWGIDSAGATQVLTLIGGVISALVAVWRIWAARAQVTPVVNPKTNAGVPLVPSTVTAVPPAPGV